MGRFESAAPYRRLPIWSGESIWRSLPEIGADGVDQFARGAGPAGIALAGGINDVDTDVVLHDLGHETGNRAPNGRYELQCLRGPRLRLESPLNGLDLSSDAADPADQLRPLADGVNHMGIVQYC